MRSQTLYNDIVSNNLTPQSFSVYDVMPPWNQVQTTETLATFEHLEENGLESRALHKPEVRKAIATLCALLPWPLLARLDAIITPNVPAYLRSTQPTLSEAQIEAVDLLRVFLPDAPNDVMPVYVKRIEQLDCVETVSGLLPWLNTAPIQTLCTPGQPRL